MSISEGTKGYTMLCEPSYVNLAMFTGFQIELLLLKVPNVEFSCLKQNSTHEVFGAKALRIK